MLRLMCLSAFVCAAAGAVADVPAKRIVAADISSISRVMDANKTFTNFRGQDTLFNMLKDAAYNTVRLRLWVDPWDGYSNLDDCLEIAEQAHDAGLDIWLDFHYSDTFADPGRQTKPAAWLPLSYDQLVGRVYDYTRSTLESFEASGVPLTYVQVGNEIQSGMLWDDGRIYVTGWPNFIQLLEAGHRGVDEADISKRPYTILHPGGPSGAPFFFQNVDSRGITYDIVGISYYPYFHGNIGELVDAMNEISSRTDKPIIVAETGYPWSFGFADNRNNLVGSNSIPSSILASFPATPEGQADYLDAIWDTLDALPNNQGFGLAYWEPAWLPGVQGGSALENLALFNFQGVALAGFERFAAEGSPIDGRGIGRDPAYTPAATLQARPPINPLQNQLDALHVSHRSGGLHIGISGNIEPNTGTAFVFIDTDPASTDGVSTLTLPNDLPNGWGSLNGLTFDDGFRPDLALAVNLWNTDLYADLFRFEAQTTSFYLGTSAVNSGDTPLTGGTNPDQIQIAYDSTNDRGLGGQPCHLASSSSRGLEVFIPRDALGTPLSGSDHVGIAVFILSRDGQILDQWLPPLPDSVPTPIDAPMLDLRQIDNLQHVLVELAQDNRTPSTLGSADLNSDGSIESSDIQLMLNRIEAQQRSSDIDGSSTIDYLDLLYLLTLINQSC